MKIVAKHPKLPGLEGPWFELDGVPTEDGEPARALVRIGAARDGRLVVTGLVAHRSGNELLARDLRRIPLAEVLDLLAGVELSPALRREIRRAPVTRVRPGPKGYGRDHFETVAEEYRRALVESPRAPMKALTERLGVSEATARRWVQRARDQGVLGESRPGKAGETKRRRGGNRA